MPVNIQCYFKFYTVNMLKIAKDNIEKGIHKDKVCTPLVSEIYDFGILLYCGQCRE